VWQIFQRTFVFFFPSFNRVANVVRDQSKSERIANFSKKTRTAISRMMIKDRIAYNVALFLAPDLARVINLIKLIFLFKKFA
jgi:hypothetical protein